MPVSSGTIISATYYNGLQTIVYGIIGPAGYGGTVASSQVAASSQVTAAQWNNLRTDINACRLIQTGTAFTNTELPLLVAGNKIFATDMNLYENAVTAIQTSYTGAMTLVSNAFKDTRTTSWTGTIDNEIQFDFGSASTADTFFNTDGELRVTLSQPTAGNLASQNWATGFANVGTIILNKTTTSKTGWLGTTSEIGWANLTSSYQIILNGYHLHNASYYSVSDLFVLAKKNAAGTGVILQVSLTNGDVTSTNESTTATYGFKKRAIGTSPTVAAVSSNTFNNVTLTPPNNTPNVFYSRTYTGSGGQGLSMSTGQVDMTTAGGMIWIKDTAAAVNHSIWDTTRGLAAGKQLATNATTAAGSGFSDETLSLSKVSGNGVLTVNSPSTGTDSINATRNHIAWLFKNNPNFFDTITWTGNGTNNRAIPHNLGIRPGMMIVKATSAAGNWYVYHKDIADSSSEDNYLLLNSSAIKSSDTSNTYFGSTAPTSANVYMGSNLNASGTTYVAYLFASDTASNGMITCGVFSGSSSSMSVNLGWEPQLLMVKPVSGTVNLNWQFFDNNLGLTQTATANKASLNPSTNAALTYGTSTSVATTNTGFMIGGGTFSTNQRVVYMAIRKSS